MTMTGTPKSKLDSTQVTRNHGLAVEVENLTKRYGPTTAVDDLSFSIARGTIAGFLGPNGAGKTTTFKMLVGLASPSSGTARVLGQNYAQLHDPIQRVGAMLEVSGYHPTRSAREHLILLARTAGISTGRVEELLDLVELKAAADRPVGGFSSGMRQRLGLAASLIGDPDLMLLDEPANGLDPKGIRWLRDFLKDLAHNQNKTIFVSSHILAEVGQMVDEVVIINHGRLVKHAPVDSVVAHKSGAVAVRTPTRDRLADALREHGATVTSQNDWLLASGIEIEDVGRIAAEGGIVLYGLREDHSTLEETFLTLTEEKVAS
ncbi:MAG: ATP-binding cassette domain-containing protein [Acidimicrobiia bacterium]